MKCVKLYQTREVFSLESLVRTTTNLVVQLIKILRLLRMLFWIPKYNALQYALRKREIADTQIYSVFLELSLNHLRASSLRLC